MSEASPQTRPVLSVAIRARSTGDRENLQQAPGILARQDPAITVKAESISGQTILSGMGELHLEIFCARILREYGVEIDVDKPTVIYLETLRNREEGEGRYIRQMAVAATTVT